jgi:hypothetical protein
LQDKVTIKIVRELHQKLVQMILGTGFGSVTEFIVFGTPKVAAGSEIMVEDKLTEEEVRAIRERVGRLGYI